MKISIYNQAGTAVGEMEVPAIFAGTKPQAQLIHQVARWQALQSYYPFAHTKNRGEVRGGGKKPWRQKGTGRARHGSIRSPLWRGGGVTFGPRKTTEFKVKINTKMRRQAVAMVVAEKLKQNLVRVLEQLAPVTAVASTSPGAHKTKQMEQVLSKFLQPRLGRKRSTGRRKKFETALLAMPERDLATVRAIRNLPYADALEARNLNILALLNHKYLVVEPKSFEVMAKILGARMRSNEKHQ